MAPRPIARQHGGRNGKYVEPQYLGLVFVKHTEIHSPGELKRRYFSEYNSENCRERYLLASTYLSSRAFPSTLLSAKPSLVSTESSHPVLLPVLDSLNHARAHPVSWIVSPISPGGSELELKLVVDQPTPEDTQLFNNYGPKPNSELLLAYGFVLPDNPEDTIVLKIGGSVNRWEVGRDAKGIEGVWEEVKAMLADKDPELAEQGWDLDVEASRALGQMVWSLFNALPYYTAQDHDEEHENDEVRLDVKLILRHYVKGTSAEVDFICLSHICRHEQVKWRYCDLSWNSQRASVKRLLRRREPTE